MSMWTNGETRSRSLQHKAARLMKWSECHLYCLRAEYFHGQINREVDWLSRSTLYLNKWSLKSSVSRQLVDRYCLPILYLFASKDNAKALCFFFRYLCPRSRGWIPFNKSSTHFVPYQFLPWFIYQMKEMETEVICVAQFCFKWSWFPDLVSMVNREHWTLPVSINHLYQGPFVHEGSGNLKLTSWFLNAGH